MSTVRARDGVPDGPLVKRPKTPASHAGNTSSNLVRVTKDQNGGNSEGIYAVQSSITVGVYDDEGPPVPIPNTVVKLIRAENTWREAARKDRSTPTPKENGRPIGWSFSLHKGVAAFREE